MMIIMDDVNYDIIIDNDIYNDKRFDVNIIDIVIMRLYCYMILFDIIIDDDIIDYEHIDVSIIDIITSSKRLLRSSRTD